MKFARQTILLAIVLSCGRLAALAQNDDPRRDSQIWPDVTANIKLDKTLNLVLFGTLRLGRDDTALTSHQAGIGISRRMGQYLSGGVHYRFIENEPTPNRQSTEHRLFADLTPRAPLKLGIQFSDRNRIEWRNINDRVSWRYRNRLQLERAFTIGERKITPYISGESMYDTRFDTWNRNQLYIGARVPIVNHFTFDGFYMRQWDARALPGFLNVVGTFIRLEF